MLGKILMLCDYYELNKPVKKIFQAIISIEITLDNVLEFFETAKMLELVESFEAYIMIFEMNF